MATLELDEAYLRAAAHLLLNAATTTRSARTMPMIGADTYTEVSDAISNFMQAVRVSREAVSDAAAVTAASIAAVMSASAALEADITRRLGPGFTG